MGSPAAATTGLAPSVIELRLTHPDLDFWVDVTVHERHGRFMATAEASRDVVVGHTPQEAVRAALQALGEPLASEMAAGCEGGA